MGVTKEYAHSNKKYKTGDLKAIIPDGLIQISHLKNYQGINDNPDMIVCTEVLDEITPDI